MTPESFIKRWRDSPLTERAASQSHFNDLCKMLGEQSPTEADPSGESFAFEKGAMKTTGGQGWADVWKRGCFAWEYKLPGKDLNAAFVQLQRYAVALENPPLLIVSDRDRFRIHTNWTNTVAETHEISVEELVDANKRQLLKWAFSDPERLKPKKTRDQLTADAAGRFADLAQRLRARGYDSHQVAHFVNRLVFCMFAEDVDLLPKKLFSKMLEAAEQDPSEFQLVAASLFRAMRKGGRVGFDVVDWFNGGLFDDDKAISLEAEDIKLIHKAAELDWAGIDPAILGTLFERGLDPDKRSQLGAHYTDRGKIMLIIEPVIKQPLILEWEAVKKEISDAIGRADEARGRRPKTQKEAQRVHTAAKRDETKARNAADELYRSFVERLKRFRVLDPACGSGNFLYLALQTLKDLERKVTLEAEALGLHPLAPTVGPESLLGIEINPYAAELARVSVWIGEIQWMRRNGFSAARDPILKSLDAIECRDAIMNENGSESEWPKADVIVGNPPFLGDKKMIRTLSEKYVTRLRTLYRPKLPSAGDLVCFWFAKAWHEIQSKRTLRCGLVATNSIRSGASSKVLGTIVSHGRIFDAWDDEPWVVDGASVRVSLVCFDGRSPGDGRLNGVAVPTIHANLTASTRDFTKVAPLKENKNCCYVGVILNGEFEIDGAVAREFLRQPTNVNGRPNSEVVRPTLNGDDFNGARPDKWVIDFGTSISEADAAMFEHPFQFIERRVKPFRQRKDAEGTYEVRATNEREIWWRHARPRPKMRKALEGLARYIATPMVSSYRTFAFLPSIYLPDQKLVIFAREDEAFLGILHSRMHELWTIETCSWIGAGNDVTYSNTAVFETFPFPEGLTPAMPPDAWHSDGRTQAIKAAATELITLRNRWLVPLELVSTEPEVAAGYSDRVTAKSKDAAIKLGKRTLGYLYADPPVWLSNAHRALDDAVAAAYGWPTDLSDADVIENLFALNQARAAAGR